METTDYTMTDFLEDANKTMENLNHSAAEVRRSANFLKWIASIAAIVLLTLYIDTNIEVNKKIDIADADNKYVTKHDALTVYNLTCNSTVDILDKYSKGDSIIILNPFYKNMIEDILIGKTNR